MSKILINTVSVASGTFYAGRRFSDEEHAALGDGFTFAVFADGDDPQISAAAAKAEEMRIAGVNEVDCSLFMAVAAIGASGTADLAAQVATLTTANAQLADDLAALTARVEALENAAGG